MSTPKKIVSKTKLFILIIHAIFPPKFPFRFPGKPPRKNPAAVWLCQAVKMVRGEMGLKNVEIMIPFVRTLDMAKDVNEVLESRSKDGFFHLGTRCLFVCLFVFGWVGWAGLVGVDNGDTRLQRLGCSKFFGRKWR